MTRTSACWLCKHFKDDTTCAAFPKGIPDNFLLGEDQHFSPNGDDNGIIFEPKNERAKEAAETLGYHSATESRPQ